MSGKRLGRERGEEQFEGVLEEIAAANPAELHTAFGEALAEAAVPQSLEDQIELESFLTPGPEQPVGSTFDDATKQEAGKPRLSVGVEELLQILRAGPPQRVRPIEAGKALLRRYHEFLPAFGVEHFRDFQERAIQALLGNRKPLVVLPTGGGKSLCYQLPAFALFHRFHCLTVVVSPLQALMEDQVHDLQNRGQNFATFLNANLDPEERRRRLEDVREGKVGLLYLSPEALRSQGVHALLRDRPPACWVVDEAHCISQWGHDFRPDYCYVPKLIRQLTEEKGGEPLLALFTATATVAVQENVRELFARHGLEIGPSVVSDATRPNLSHRVIRVNANKEHVLLREVRETLQQPGCVLIYTTTRKESEQLAQLLQQEGFSARHYHGGMRRREKREVLDEFKAGDLRVVAATCAFGMGINRADVRGVIHHCISTSLESYVQETGRAGRDGAPATCILLFREEDADLLFALRARGHLSDHDLRNVFTAALALRNRVHRSASEDWFWASPMELGRAAATRELGDLTPEDGNTRLRVAIHLLEDFKMLERDVNLSSCLRFDLIHSDPVESEKLIRTQPLEGKEQERLVRLVRAMHALRARPENADRPLPTDLLCDAAGLPPDQLFAAVRELHRLGVCTFAVPLSLVFTRADNQYGARQKHRWLREVESTLLECLLEVTREHGRQINLRGLTNRLKLRRKQKPRASTLRELLDAWSAAGWIGLESVALDVVRLEGLDNVTSRLERHKVMATGVLDALYARATGDDAEQRVQIELGHLLEQVGKLVSPEAEPKELEQVLGWLHDRDVMRIDEGLNLVRQAFKLRVFRGRQLRSITRLHGERVEPWYQDQYRRTHLMVRYGQISSDDPEAGRQLLESYFRLPREEFDDRHGLNKREEKTALRKPILPGEEKRILDDLNDAQQEVVNAEEAALAVVAGPGSGKTRCIVHRIAALVKIKQVPPERILALAYNRNAVRELRIRLRGLIGPQATGLKVHTFHGLALSILGRTLGEVLQSSSEDPTHAGYRMRSPGFDELLAEVCDLLENGDGVGGLPDDVLARRAQLLGGLEYIFVDEYQDIDELQYRFIKLLAGLRQAGAPDAEQGEGEAPGEFGRRVQIRLCVIGDDDQNIYAFRGASNRFLLQFEQEYEARRVLLTENYRSTESIIEAANRLIAHNTDRCKRESIEQVRINEARRGQFSRPVEAWQFADVAARAEWTRQKVHEWLEQGAAPGEIAILAPRWDDLGPVRLLLEQDNVTTQALDRGPVRLVRNRATCMLLEALRRSPHTIIGRDEMVETRMRNYFTSNTRSLNEPTVHALLQIARDIDRERGDGSGEDMLPITCEDVAEAIYEFDAANETHPDAQSVLVTSCHGAKGLEFRHVILFTDGFQPSRTDIERAGSYETALAEKRRLFYVAMTRAKDELIMCGTEVSPLVKESGLAVTQAPPANVVLPARLVYRDLTPKDVNLGHQAMRQQQCLIKRLQEGDFLQFRVNEFGDGWLVYTPEGEVIGDLSRQADQDLRKLGLGAGSFQFRDSEVRVGRIFQHLSFNDVTGEKTEDWFVVLPQIRVCR